MPGDTKPTYPVHVIDAVAAAIFEAQHPYTGYQKARYWKDVGKLTADTYRATAAKALQAIWDVSRIDELGQIDDLMPDAMLCSDKTTPPTLISAGGLVNRQDIDLLPVHVVHWGS